jgi:glycosyltransferase involved in cell wall biosynthesis
MGVPSTAGGDSLKPASRVLLASYHFPPDAAVGGLRAAKFARALPDFGWQPFVLTARDDLRDQGLDESRLAGLEGVPVVRTGELPRIIEALVDLAKLGLNKRSRAASPLVRGGIGVPSESVKAKLTRWIVSLLLLLPDENKNWALRAAGTAVRLIRRHRMDWVITSGPPFSVHVIGLAAKAFTQARWIADFRDPWIDMLPERFAHTRSLLSDRMEKWMEAAVVRHADRVLTTTERMRDAMAARYPSAPSGHFVCIPNSIDTERIQVPDRLEKYEPLTITYTGVIYLDRSPEPMFRALSRLIESGRASSSDVRIKLVGQCRSIEGVDTREIAARYGLEDAVEVIDRVPYSEAVQMMRRSHLLLMLAPECHRLVLPAKIFDYLGSGSTVLAIAEPGATADFVTETRCGRCFSAQDIEGLAEYLAGLLRDGAFRQLKSDPASFSRYDVRRATGLLAAQMANGNAESFDELIART